MLLLRPPDVWMHYSIQWVFLCKISPLFVNGSTFIALWTGRMAASKQNNNCFIKPAKNLQMVAAPQSLSQLWLFKPIEPSHFSPQHASSCSMKQFRNRCKQICKLISNNPSLSSECYWTGSDGHSFVAYNCNFIYLIKVFEPFFSRLALHLELHFCCQWWILLILTYISIEDKVTWHPLTWSDVKWHPVRWCGTLCCDVTPCPTSPGLCWEASSALVSQLLCHWAKPLGHADPCPEP